jgi:hypothetical protein
MAGGIHFVGGACIAIYVGIPRLALRYLVPSMHGNPSIAKSARFS